MLKALILAVTLSAYSSMQAPSLMDQPLSDLGILRYAEAVKSRWGMRSLNTEALSVGGEISVAALSTGALVASAETAQPGITRGLIGASSNGWLPSGATTRGAGDGAKTGADYPMKRGRMRAT